LSERHWSQGDALSGAGNDALLRCNAENPASVNHCLLCGSQLTLAETATPRKPVAASAGQNGGSWSGPTGCPRCRSVPSDGRRTRGLALLDEAVEHTHERYREAEIHRLHGQLLLALRSRCSEWPIRLSCSASITPGSRISSH
jgi:hypothetical protein